MFARHDLIEEYEERRLAALAAADEERLLREHELRTMEYDLYLLTPEWRARRAQALARAQHRCQVCNATGPLDVHHRTYERRGDERPEDLTVLCWHCHALYHQLEALPAQPQG